jgi:CBS domain-containing protein
MLTVRQVISRDQHKVHTIGPDQPVQAAIEIMAARRISALPVVVGNHLVGIVSERDFVRKVASRGRPASGTTIREIMTEKVITVELDDPIALCMQLMTTNRIRHLPVLATGRLAAIISITDVVRALEKGWDPAFLRERGAL